jgi:hypothetical protein
VVDYDCGMSDDNRLDLSRMETLPVEQVRAAMRGAFAGAPKEAVAVEWQDVEPSIAQVALDQAIRTMERMDAHIGELRAILAPQLDDPAIIGNRGYYCLFCNAEDWDPNAIPHKADCPVLRKDELLGRG